MRPWVGKKIRDGYDMQLGPSREIGANAFAYPFGYPKRMTDWGSYAKNSACTHCLKTRSRRNEKEIANSAI